MHIMSVSSRCGPTMGRQAAMHGERERKKVTDAASGRACSVFFLLPSVKPALGGTTSQACSWRAWMLGDEHAGLTSTLCLHNVSHESSGGDGQRCGYAPALS